VDPVDAGRRPLVDADLRARVHAWVAADPDPANRTLLLAELGAADGGDEAAARLADRFAGRLAFGTAGLRADSGRPCA
jgi:phosphomannomutase